MNEKITIRPGLFILLATSVPTILFGYFFIVELTKYQNSVCFFVILFLISLIAPIAHWFKNKIVLENNIVSIKSFLFLPRTKEMCGPFYSFETPTSKKFDINTVKSITIRTTWVFRSVRNNIDKVGIGENIDIYCEESGHQERITVELFRFPGFKKIIKEILKTQPQVKMDFVKGTAIENIKRLKW